MLRAEPKLVALLLEEVLGVAVPPFEGAETSEADFSQTLPAEFRADLVVILRDAEHAPVMAIVVEVQRKRDEAKRRAWPLYVAALHARMNTPCCLLVLAANDGIARWASAAITTLQPCSPFHPLVVGPSSVPRVSAERAHREPHLAVLSALVHGDGPGGLDIVLAAIDAVTDMDEQRGRLFFDLILAALSAATRALLEAEMQPGKYEYKSDFARKYFNAGREEGRAEALHAVRTSLLHLAMHRVPTLRDDLRQRIASCSDVERLSATIVEVGRATDATAIERLLGEL
ncbi:MAG: hypothetical protein F9K40_03735 [Kofleriaceae bacterium]|nr:MAG: hypothetical protein F9K40_03735 [Kofleriaceae bacterium]MBZ0232000.1 hypothetical protein [Kofleriaceae bacterium]